MSRRFLLVPTRDQADAFGDNATVGAAMERRQMDASHSAL